MKNATLNATPVALLDAQRTILSASLSTLRLLLAIIVVSVSLFGAHATDAGLGCQILFDEGHHNVHTADGKNLELIRLLRQHGFALATHQAAFDRSALEDIDLLIVSTPRGAPASASMEARSKPAFSDEEIDVVHDWVSSGGGLLLVTDHPPIGAASRELGTRFGVEMSIAFTEDSALSQQGQAVEGNPRNLVFSRVDGSLVSHPITDGQHSVNRVERVVTYYGQSLACSAACVPFLALSPHAVDRQLQWRGQYWAQPSPDDPLRSAAGRSQGLATTVDRGRLVVLGEAGLLTNRHLQNDHERLAINIVKWLLEQNPCRKHP